VNLAELYEAWRASDFEDVDVLIELARKQADAAIEALDAQMHPLHGDECDGNPLCANVQALVSVVESLVQNIHKNTNKKES
jgi:hypothetical protein